MKRLRRLLLFSSAVWAFVAVAGVYSVYLARGTPDWYHARNLTVEQRQTAANVSDQTIAGLVSYANDLAAAERRHYRTGEAITIGPRRITLTDDQINAFLEKWESSPPIEELGLTRHLADERIALLEGKVLVAATVKDEGMLSNVVLSMELSLDEDDQNRLAAGVTRIYSGRLSIPRALLGSPEQRLRSALERDIEEWRQEQHEWPDGLSDTNAAAAGWASLVLAALDNRAVDGVLPVPCNMGGLNLSVPIRVTGLHVGDGEVTFTVQSPAMAIAGH